MIHPLVFALLFFAGMLGLLEVGHRIAMSRGADSEPGTIETALFALFGLLIAFTFSGAATRFQEKRTLVAEEANTIQTAYRYIDVVAPEAQAKLRDEFREYVDSRLEIYHRLPDLKAAAPAIARMKQLQKEMWAAAIAATRLPSDDPAAARMLLPAIDSMNRVSMNRTMALQNHPPGVVYGLLFVLGLLCALLAGFRLAGRGKRSWLHIVSFALITASVVYISLDMEYPRIGFIRLDKADQMLRDVRANMD
jgi:hypothetical protein